MLPSLIRVCYAEGVCCVEGVCYAEGVCCVEGICCVVYVMLKVYVVLKVYVGISDGQGGCHPPPPFRPSTNRHISLPTFIFFLILSKVSHNKLKFLGFHQNEN